LDKETLVNKFSSSLAMGDKTMKPVDPYKELQSIVVSECYLIYLVWIDGE